MSNEPPIDPRYADLQRQYASRPARQPVRVEMLEYAQPQAKPRVHVAFQFILGLLLPIAYTLVAAAAMPARYAFGLLPVHAGVIISIAVIVRVQLRWKGFLPGVLTVILAAPVVFFVICAIALSNI